MMPDTICGSEQLCYLSFARPPGEPIQPPLRLPPARGFLVQAEAGGGTAFAREYRSPGTLRCRSGETHRFSRFVRGSFC